MLPSRILCKLICQIIAGSEQVSSYRITNSKVKVRSDVARKENEDSVQLLEVHEGWYVHFWNIPVWTGKLSFLMYNLSSSPRPIIKVKRKMCYGYVPWGGD